MSAAVRFNPYSAGPSFDLVSYHDAREKSEVKDDPEQLLAYERIVELLGVAGYFRVRLPGLSPFDKVLGGLAWAISASAVAVDVDVFFDDDATLGEKNARAEDVCRALLRMKCPHALRSFQITRCDWRSVHPVVTWLIRTVLETREETALLLRTFAQCEFARGEGLNLGTPRADDPLLNQLTVSYGPKRRLRQRTQASAETERVLNVLREYSNSAANSSSAAAAFNESDYALSVAAANVSGAVVGGILGLQSDALRHWRAQYEAQSQAKDARAIAARMHAGRVEGLRKRCDESRAEHAALLGQHAAAVQQLHIFAERIEAVKRDNERRRAEMAAFRASLSAQAAVVAELQRLVALNEALRGHMEAFEASCARQADELKARVGAMRAAGEADAAAAVGEAEQKRLQATRQLVARKGRALLLLRRKIDEVPTHAELSQYARMLLELYEQINGKFVETRKYYNSFNSLDDTRRYLERELSILKSISDQYGDAMKSKSNKDAFVHSLQQIVGSVEQSHDKTRGKQREETERRDLLHRQHVELLDKQRDYAKLTKEFSQQAALAAQYEARLQAAAPQ